MNNPNGTIIISLDINGNRRLGIQLLGERRVNIGTGIPLRLSHTVNRYTDVQTQLEILAAMQGDYHFNDKQKRAIALITEGTR